MNYLKVNVKESSTNLGGFDPEDGWSRDSTEGDAWVESAWISNLDGYNCISFVDDLVPGETVYVILAVYGTGDSFGSDGGQYEVMDASRDEVYILEKLESLKEDGSYAVPWNGYFNWLQELKLTTHKV